MSSKFRGLVIFIAGAIFSTWIGTFIANPLGEKVFSFFSAMPSKFSLFFLDHICSFIPRYETQNTSTLWATIGIGLLCGAVLNAYHKSADKIADEKMIDIEDIEIEEDLSDENNPSKFPWIIDKIIDHLFVFYEFLEKHVFKYISLLFLGVIFLAINFWFLRAVTVTTIATDVLRKIEIVSPYISDLEYKQMKSDFYLIEDWDDYDQLDKHLDALMESEGISLPNK